MGKSPRFGDMVNDTASVELIIKDSSDFSMIRLIEILKNNFGDYSAMNANCQHFAKFIFDKVADRKHWEFTEPRSFLQKVMARVVGLFVTSAVVGGAVSVAVIVDKWQPRSRRGDNQEDEGEKQDNQEPEGEKQDHQDPAGENKTTQNPAGGQKTPAGVPAC